MTLSRSFSPTFPPKLTSRALFRYIDLAVTQLFYTSNMFHDLTYRLGFDELAGNFQQGNFGKGGREGDAVIAVSPLSLPHLSECEAGD